MSSFGRVSLPGFGRPIDELPKWQRQGEQKRLPHAIADFYASTGVTVRERRMLDFVNQIGAFCLSDKPEWERKVFDEDIVSKWKQEAVRFDASIEEPGHLWLSEEMFNVCILELREKAEVYRETGFVSVLDAEATVAKSDRAISEDLGNALRRSVRALEDVPDRFKDWHPGSDGKVLDLVHPSLFPVVYGLTKALPHGKVPLEGCASYTGKGEIIPEFSATLYLRPKSWGDTESVENAWGSFQWLPSEVTLVDGIPKVSSYINNLHPDKHQDLYGVLGQFVQAALPLWEECLSWFHSRLRIVVDQTGRDDYHVPEGIKFDREQYRNHQSDDEESEDEEDDDSQFAWQHDCHDEYEEWLERNRILDWPEPTYKPQSEMRERAGARPIDLKLRLAESGLQIIFKLANIHLTPDKPTYDGGSWHVEGSLNEHICATALYYYDSENVTDSHLSFRQSFDSEAMVMKPEQHHHESAEAFFGVSQNGSTIMPLGSVLTRPNRLLAFPNVLQHQVQPFKLADSTKPGHRKILAMFLIDPHIPILSTANVPPQRRDWWAKEVRKVNRFAELPEEIFDMIIEGVDGFPISWDAALDIRARLMSERGALEEGVNSIMDDDSFFFCEH